MTIYLAGGVNGNLKVLWDQMKIFFAGINGRREVIFDEFVGKAMKIYLADTYYGNQSRATKSLGIKAPLPPILESFYYVDETTEAMLPFMKDFLLDSGAFTYMSGNGGKVNWEKYIDDYAQFIVKNDVEKFIELDIDSIVGYAEVKRLRKILIEKTGKLPIPVWHKNRGRKGFLEMIDNFPYVAIGGIVTKEIKKSEYGIFEWFIRKAHEKNVKIHGLGLTNFNAIYRYKFDSVDSSSWTSGNRFGHVCKFDGRKIVNISKEGSRIADPRMLAINNFKEWIKFSQYAEKNL